MLSPFAFFKGTKKQNIGDIAMITLDLNKDEGFVLDLTKVDPSLKKVQGTMIWDGVGKDFDPDFFLFQLNEQERVTSKEDIIYFKHKFNSNRSISVPFDSRENGVPEDFIIDFDNVPANISAIPVFIFLFEAEKNGQDFGQMTKGEFVLKNSETDVAIASFRLMDYAGDTSLHLGNFVRNGSSWNFEPEGVSSTKGVIETINYFA